MHLISPSVKNLQSRLDERCGLFGLRRSATGGSNELKKKTRSKKAFYISYVYIVDSIEGSSQFLGRHRLYWRPKKKYFLAIHLKMSLSQAFIRPRLSPYNFFITGKRDGAPDRRSQSLAGDPVAIYLEFFCCISF
jgi:hypothetical protein